MFVVTVMQGVVIDEQRHVRHPQLGGRADHLEPVIAAVIASRTCRVRSRLRRPHRNRRGGVVSGWVGG